MRRMRVLVNLTEFVSFFKFAHHEVTLHVSYLFMDCGRRLVMQLSLWTVHVQLTSW